MLDYDDSKRQVPVKSTSNEHEQVMSKVEFSNKHHDVQFYLEEKIERRHLTNDI